MEMYLCIYLMMSDNLLYEVHYSIISSKLLSNSCCLTFIVLYVNNKVHNTWPNSSKLYYMLF